MTSIFLRDSWEDHSTKRKEKWTARQRLESCGHKARNIESHLKLEVERIPSLGPLEGKIAGWHLISRFQDSTWSCWSWLLCCRNYVGMVSCPTRSHRHSLPTGCSICDKHKGPLLSYRWKTKSKASWKLQGLRVWQLESPGFPECFPCLMIAFGESTCLTGRATGSLVTISGSWLLGVADVGGR